MFDKQTSLVFDIHRFYLCTRGTKIYALPNIFKGKQNIRNAFQLHLQKNYTLLEIQTSISVTCLYKAKSYSQWLLAHSFPCSLVSQFEHSTSQTLDHGKYA